MKRSLLAALVLLAVAGCSAVPRGSPPAGSATAGPSRGGTSGVGITRLGGVDPADRTAAGIEIAFDDTAAQGLLAIPVAASAP